MLIAAVVLITAALLFYTAGVWAEHRAGVLTPRHAVLFGLGLAADASGTWFMGRIAAAGGMTITGAAGLLTQIMTVTGTIALILMGLHFAWAIVVLLRDRDEEKRVFHRFSVAVWAVWLVPYITGMAGSMAS